MTATQQPMPLAVPVPRPATVPTESKVRLFFDEDVSPRVAAALEALGRRVEWIGKDDGLPKRTPDQVIVEKAKREHWILVTINHDLIMAAAARGARVVWFDPRGKPLNLAEQVVMAFTQMDLWSQLLEADGGCGVRAMRTQCVALPMDELGRLAAQRFRRRKQKEKRRRVHREASKQLGLEDILDDEQAG